jgi:hypothetical protein
VIDATFDVREIDRPNQCQWLVRTARLNRHCSKDQENDATTHIDLTHSIAVPMTAARLDEVIVGAEVKVEHTVADVGRTLSR